ncbi:MAG: hypothetical protein HC913_18215 [Microscillaceae bacterium]|nr:hypothetical protein [Microscillaceae bacterium]
MQGILEIDMKKWRSVLIPGGLLLMAFGLEGLLMPGAWWHGRKWWLWGFFVSLAITSHRLSEAGRASRPSQFLIYFVVGMMIRLLLSLAFLAFLLNLRLAHQRLLILNFFLFYFLFFVFEIHHLLGNLQTDKKNH